MIVMHLLKNNYLELPHALANESGIPNKDQKSDSTALYYKINI